MVVAHGFEHLEAVQVGHLDVEEYEVWTLLQNRFDGVASARALAQQSNPRRCR